MILFGGMMLSGALAVAGVVGWIVWVATSGPEIKELKPREQGRSSQIFASDGTRIGFLQSRVVRQPISSQLVPEYMRQATVAVEDRRFYDHTGVDFSGVVRAAFRNITSGKTVEGGSTLTMQLVRTLYADKDRNIKRKIREAKLAEELENVHSGAQGKRWILNQYLNNVPYGTSGGQEIIGVQAAARAFYDKPAKDLTLAQSAMLAGLPQAPTDYNPLINPNDARTRRDDVLTRMEDQGMITAAEADEARASEIDVKPGGSGYYSTRTEGHVFDYVKKQLIEEYGRSTVSRGGLKVYTTIDLRLQRAARKAMADNLGAPGMPSSAIV
ncbi:MAG: penicillin-binding protein, partial [Solirubrobacteraceae bacterium]|nr:penicillin-binding protein [Solirubrobacteraceae bacterium]